MTRLGRWIDWWMFEAYRGPAASLPLYRIFYALFLLSMEIPRSTRVWELPQSFFLSAISPALFFHGFPSRSFFFIADLLLTLGGAALLLGWFTRFFSFFVAGLLVLEMSFQYALGKVSHEILVAAVPFFLGFSGWGARYSMDSRSRKRGVSTRPSAWPVALLVFAISLCMLSAAISKAKSGWLDWRLECCRGQLLLNYVGLDRDRWLANAFASIDSHLFWKFLDYSTVALEGGFIVTMFWLPAIRFLAASACIFHGMIFYSMNILFAANPPAYAAVADLRFVLRWRWVRTLFRAPASLWWTFFTALGWVYAAEYLAKSTHAGLLPIPAPIVAALFILFGAWGVIFVLLQGMDWILWRLHFPLRRGKIVVLYDGECGLCDRWVQFVLKRDKRGSIQFAPLQSKIGGEMSGRAPGKVDDLSSVVVWADGRLFRRSDAVAIIVRQLGFPWSFAGVGALLPRAMRDWGYAFIAARRHKWFPAPDACRLLTKREKSRFLE